MTDSVPDAWETARPPTRDDPDSAGTPLDVFLDEQIAAEQAAVPHWFGVRWRDLTIEDRAAAMQSLREWVNWFCVEYQVPATSLPGCWYHHRPLVAELYAAQCAEYRIWQEGEPGIGAMTTWHYHVPLLLTRLKEAATRLTCTGGTGHRPDKPTPQFTIHEEDWTRFIAAGAEQGN